MHTTVNRATLSMIFKKQQTSASITTFNVDHNIEVSINLLPILVKIIFSKSLRKLLFKIDLLEHNIPKYFSLKSSRYSQLL